LIAQRLFAVREMSKLNFKRRIFQLIAFVLFHSGALKAVNYFVNHFQFTRRGEELGTAPFVKRRRFGNLQILVYHRVNDDEDPFFPGLPTGIFRRQMEYLAENFTLLALEEAVARLRKQDIPDNAVVVTFDDGYRDNYVNAFPILKSFSVPATVFLTTDAIGSGRVIWHDRVFCAFRDTQSTDLAGIGGISRTYRLTTLEEKLRAQSDFLQFIRGQKDLDRLKWIDWLIENFQVTDRKTMPGLMLSWEEIRTMLRDGISFGSHTVSHPILSRQQEEQVRDEIWKSKQEIEKELGVPTVTFAYPNGNVGDFDETTKALLRDAGYKCAVTTRFGSNGYDQDLFELRRATPWDQAIYGFALRLNWFKFAF
jgi:peptidoglycan/xylan/chitin deacetylase (PgdA/CDA1 family)